MRSAQIQPFTSDTLPNLAAAPDSGRTARLQVSVMADEDIMALARQLWHEAVYRHIGGLPQAPADVEDWLRRTLAGPPADEPPQRWLNYTLRRQDSGAYAGLLQATLHEGIAEVAYLLAPAQWGQGLAGEALRWLHGELARVSPGTPCWATTLPANERSWRLLERCGYARVAPALAPVLMTFEPGDWVFRRQGSPQGGPGA